MSELPCRWRASAARGLAAAGAGLNTALEQPDLSHGAETAQLRDALREAQERCCALSAVSGDAVWVWRHGGESPSESATAWWCGLTGQTPEEANGWRGCGWLRAVSRDDRARVRAARRESVERSGDFAAEFCVRARDGGRRWVRARGVSVRGPDGSVREWVSVLADITEQRRAEHELERYSTQLERLIAERTAALEATHEQLRLTERMAALGTLSAGLGHDMGNLLLPLRAHLDVMRARMGSLSQHELREHLEAIAQCADHLQSLTGGLRLFARDPDRNGQDHTSLGAWIHDAEPFYRHALPGGVELVCEFPEGLPPVALAPHALTQAVLNLVRNAGEAFGGRAGRVTIRARACPGDVVRVEVEDDGPGIPPEVRRHVLEPFYTTKTRTLSTGLGLTRVHGIVRAANGRVEIESGGEGGGGDVGGTRISLILPCAPGAGASGAERGALSAGVPRTVLVSVHDPRSASLLGALLDAMGCEVRRREGSPDAEQVWIADAHLATPAAVAEFLSQDPPRRLLVLADSGAWSGDDRAVLLQHPITLDELRRAMRPETTA